MNWFYELNQIFSHSNDSNLISKSKRIAILSQPNISLLLSIWSNQGINASHLLLKHLLKCFSDLMLICTWIYQKHHCIFLLHLFHGLFSCWGLEQYCKFVKTVFWWERWFCFVGVFWGTESLQCLWTMKTHI